MAKLWEKWLVDKVLLQRSRFREYEMVDFSLLSLLLTLNLPNNYIWVRPPDFGA